MNAGKDADANKNVLLQIKLKVMSTKSLGSEKLMECFLGVGACL